MAAPAKPPLLREHSLYQADWLFCFYGFALDELVTRGSDPADFSPLDVDPKLAWALATIALKFPGPREPLPAA